MPGRNPHEAVVAFMGPLRDALAVLDGHAQLIVHRRSGYRMGVPYVWILNDEDGMLLRGVGRLRATMQFSVIACDPATTDGGHPFRVTTLGYNYKISDADDRDIVRFHWHPSGRAKNPHPHIHARPDLDAHFYMPRVTLETVIRGCLELGAPLTVDAAEAVRHLAVTEAPHMLYRSWTDWPPGQDEPFRTAGAPGRGAPEP